MTHPTIPNPPPRPRHINDDLGRAVIEPPTREAIERISHWRHANRQRLEFNRVLRILDDPKSYA